MRIILQSVERASLLVDNVDEWVHIGRGIIVYLSFLKGSTREMATKAVGEIVGAKIFPSVDMDLTRGRAVKAGAQGWDFLVVPQATLAGKIKGKQAQYHAQLDKEEGAELYTFFCSALREAVAAAERDTETAPTAGTVQNGTYGNRQGLKMESLGPFTHMIEYS